MTIWTGVAIFYSAIAAVEITAAMIGAGIPLIRDKIRKRRKGRP